MSHGKSATCKVRLYFVEESSSGMALKFAFAPKRADAFKHIWIPKSVIEHTTKFPKGDGHDYAQYELTIPEWIAEQKDLGDCEV